MSVSKLHRPTPSFGKSYFPFLFFVNERYPGCDFSTWDMPTNEKCPDCGKMLFRKKGKSMLVCHDEACKYSREIPANAKEQSEE